MVILSRKEGSKLSGKLCLESSVFRKEPMTLCRMPEVSFAVSVLKSVGIHMLVEVLLLVEWQRGLLQVLCTPNVTHKCVLNLSVSRQ